MARSFKIIKIKTMIKIKPADLKFANVDPETKRQLRELAVDEAFGQAVSETELQQRLGDTRKVVQEAADMVKNITNLYRAIEKRVLALEKPKRKGQLSNL